MMKIPSFSRSSCASLIVRSLSNKAASISLRSSCQKQLSSKFSLLKNSLQTRSSEMNEDPRLINLHRTFKKYAVWSVIHAVRAPLLFVWWIWFLPFFCIYCCISIRKWGWNKFDRNILLNIVWLQINDCGFPKFIISLWSGTLSKVKGHHSSSLYQGIRFYIGTSIWQMSFRFSSSCIFDLLSTWWEFWRLQWGWLDDYDMEINLFSKIMIFGDYFGYMVMFGLLIFWQWWIWFWNEWQYWQQ